LRVHLLHLSLFCCFLFIVGSSCFPFFNKSQQRPFLQPVSMATRSSNEPETSP
jgi:hypothetical protein